MNPTKTPWKREREMGVGGRVQGCQMFTRLCWKTILANGRTASTLQHKCHMSASKELENRRIAHGGGTEMSTRVHQSNELSLSMILREW